MRFACQSCGKAYNLPEEKIADKSNVKLKCRVCGAIVEVKKQGEVVAAILGESDNKRGRVSEAPAPLTSMMPDDGDDATHAIAVGDQILSESGSSEDAASALLGHVKSALAQGGLGPLPSPPPTGFGVLPSLSSGAGIAPPGPVPSAAGVGAPPAGHAPTPVPPPLAAPELARSEPVQPFAWPEPPQAPPLPSGGSMSGVGSPPPPPLPGSGVDALPPAGLHPAAGLQGGAGVLQNGSNGVVPRFGDVVPLPDEPMAPVAMASGASAALSPAGTLGDLGGYGGGAAVELQPPAANDDTTRKMLASLATGILIGFIIARLFF